MNKGKVYLVGAGPGDPQLLTLKAKKVIEQADVVVYDRLVSLPIMRLIPQNAELIDVGKSTCNHTVPQEEINKILLNKALQGKTVVRLKGGDPFVFGRGGEELELLSKNNINFEVVPGITAPIAAAAYGGIPVTHRDYCSSLHIITGHAKKNSELNLDFKSLVALNGTLVFMMSVSTVGDIAQGLLSAGMDRKMPCAVIENGTRGNQRKVISTLENIKEDVLSNKIVSPAIIIVGKVCSLSEDFDWFSKLPLKGAKIILTQSQKKKSNFESKLLELGAEVATYPCIETYSLKPDNIPFQDFDIIVFTSEAGVREFYDYLSRNNLDSRVLYGKKIACVGTQTANALKNYGINADFVPGVFDGEHLAKEAVSSGFINKTNKVLLLRAEKASNEILDIFKNEKIDFTDIAIYTTSLIKSNQIDYQNYDYITFTSKSCVEGFVQSQNVNDFNKAKAVCIGNQTAKMALNYNFDVIVSEKSTIDSMVNALIKDYNKEA